MGVKRDWFYILTFIDLMIKFSFFILFTCANFSLYYIVKFAKLYPITSCIFLLIIMSFYFLFKNRGKLWYLFSMNLIVSIFLVFDLWYYRSFESFLSVNLLSQATNLDNLSDSILSLAKPYDILFFIDLVLILFFILKNKKIYLEAKRSISLFLITLIIPTASIYLLHVKYDVKDKGNNIRFFLSDWSADTPMYTLSPLGYEVRDVFLHYKEKDQHLKLTSNDKKSIQDWYANNVENLPDNKYKGMFKGKNLIIIQVESLENFMLNQKKDNQEITPNLNNILKHSLYFPNYYEEVSQGNSSDADLMTNTSIYPVRMGSTFFKYSDNKYKSLPLLLNELGYRTMSVHPDKGNYWNCRRALTSIGFNKCLDLANFKQDELIGMGISDRTFFNQGEQMVKNMKQPFYTFMVTLTSHMPFNLPNQYRELKFNKSFDETKIGGYLQSVHYTDKQIGMFLNKLKKDGILKNTVVVIYGDHCGIHKYYQDDLNAMSAGEKWWKNKNKKIPFIIYNEGIKGKEISTIGGQIDLMPTIAYVMGIDKSKYADSAMGRNLLNTKKSFAVLSNGTYIGKSKTDKDKKKAIEGLMISDKIIRGNYFKNSVK